MRARVRGLNQLNNQVLTSTSAYLDAWNVQSRPSLVISQIYNNLSNVNSGQQDLIVEMRIANQGQATALLDTAGLFTIPGPTGNIIDSLITALDSIPGGLVDTLRFNTDVAALLPGTFEIDGSVNYFDANDSTALITSNAINTHTWSVGSDASLAIDSIQISTPTMSLGQTGVLASAIITNTGDASLQMDSLRITFDNQINRPPVSAILVSPSSLPILGAGQNFTAIYEISAAETPIDSGYITIDLRAYGTDQVTSAAVSDLGSSTPDSILLQTQADVQIV